jgi:hypothetical protein
MNYVTLLSTLISAIHAVEALMPNSPGKEKFDAAITIVQGVVGDVAPIVPQLMTIATTVVNGLRAVGKFQNHAPSQ